MVLDKSVQSIKFCQNVLFYASYCEKALQIPIGITHKKFEGNISKIDSFIEIFVTRENNVPLIFPPFLPFK